jgi:hypothetical protein
VSIRSRLRVRNLAWVALAYAAWLWWIHHLVRSPLNHAYFTQYVTMRCTAAATDRLGGPPRSKERVAALADELSKCQGLAVAVDGVWGGMLRTPAVRLRVVPGEGAATLAYYAVDVDPILGIASIRYDLSPELYYWSF